MSDTFKCGHPKTAENSTPVGNGYMRCRKCKYRLDSERVKRKRASEPQIRKKRGPHGPRDKSQTPNFPCGHPRTPDNQARMGRCRQCLNAAQLRYYHSKKNRAVK